VAKNLQKDGKIYSLDYKFHSKRSYNQRCCQCGGYIRVDDKTTRTYRPIRQHSSN